MFQYAAILRHTTEDDRVYTFRHEATDLLVLDRRFTLIPGTGRVVRKFNFHLNALVRLAVRLRLVGSVKPAPQLLLGRFVSEQDVVETRQGPIFRDHFVVQGYFQFGRFHDVPIRIRPDVLEPARRRLQAATGGATTVAVHIRLTDYGTWTVLGQQGALVPPAWYQARMAELAGRLASPVFVIYSDDLAAARRIPFDQPVVYSTESSAAGDFASMALCDHAIVSPSSFAWWAAQVFRRADKRVMAPLYWAGFKSSLWYPPTIETAGIEYSAVPS